MKIPEKKEDLIKFANDVRDICCHSMGQRQALYRQYRRWIETGRQNGKKSLNNRLYSHQDRLASYLFSPSDLRFQINYENYYPKETLLQAETASKLLSREWRNNDIDLTFGQGVREALDYGSCIIKALAVKGTDDDGNTILRKVDARLVPPWRFGVYDENENSLVEQDATCEVAYLTLPQVWRRIAHLPDAEKLFSKIKANSTSNTASDDVGSFFHQVLSTSTLQTNLESNTSPLPGGIVTLGNNAADVITSADNGANVVKFYELNVWNDDTGDYVTIQTFDPDILVAPLYKKTNLYCPKSLPYGLIQPNRVSGYFWGRTEIMDLTEQQGLLSDTLDDVRRLMGIQFDKLMAFTGVDGMTDELYDQFRSQGYIGLQQGASVEDLTPKLPPESFEYIKMITSFMDETGGFGNILSGQGDSGVRSGNYAGMLMKTGSPRIRDRSIILERQCSTFGETVLAGLEAKNDKLYWTDAADGPETEFFLSQLPKDRRVSVDSHSSSPIYEDDHKALVGELLKTGIISGDSALDLLSIPMQDLLKQRYKEMQQHKQEQQDKAAQNPDYAKLLLAQSKKKG